MAILVKSIDSKLIYHFGY